MGEKSSERTNVAPGIIEIKQDVHFGCHKNTVLP